MPLYQKHQDQPAGNRHPRKVTGRFGVEVSAFALDLGGELAPRLGREREHLARAVPGVAHQD